MSDSKKTKAQLIQELQALRVSFRAAQLQAGFFASAMDAIIVIDDAQTIIQFNSAAEQVFGYSREEILGQPIHVLLPERNRGRHNQLIQNYADTGITSRTMRTLGTLAGRRADGSIFPIEASISQHTVGDEKFFAAIVRDISARQYLENLILRQYDSLNTLHLVTLDLLNQRDVKELLQFIVDQAVKLLEVSYCEILLPEGGDLVAQAFTRGRPFQAGNRISREEGQLSWQVFDSGLPSVLEDYSTWDRRHKIYEDEEFHAAAALPLLVRDQCIGVLGMTRDKPGYTFSEEHILTATRLAAIAALAIENSRLYSEVKRLATTDELTGVHNRRNLIAIGERDVQRALRYNRDLSALLLDVDHFKQVNDTWGHASGDIVLHDIAQEIVRQFRKTDTIGRYNESSADDSNIIGRFGGEEFGILLPETPLKGALIVAERIRSRVKQMRFTVANEAGSSLPTGTDIHVTVSIGASSLHSEPDTLADLLSRADQGLYLAKQSGRNRVCAISE